MDLKTANKWQFWFRFWNNYNKSIFVILSDQRNLLILMLLIGRGGIWRTSGTEGFKDLMGLKDKERKHSFASLDSFEYPYFICFHSDWPSALWVNLFSPVTGWSTPLSPARSPFWSIVDMQILLDLSSHTHWSMSFTHFNLLFGHRSSCFSALPMEEEALRLLDQRI